VKGERGNGKGERGKGKGEKGKKEEAWQFGSG
jgi:hypothetical protein